MVWLGRATATATLGKVDEGRTFRKSKEFHTTRSRLTGPHS